MFPMLSVRQMFFTPARCPPVVASKQSVVPLPVAWFAVMNVLLVPARNSMPYVSLLSMVFDRTSLAAPFAVDDTLIPAPVADDELFMITSTLVDESRPAMPFAGEFVNVLPLTKTPFGLPGAPPLSPPMKTCD